MGLFQTWKKVMFDPQVFYEKLPKKIRYSEPTRFFLKIQALVMLIYLVILGMAALFISAIGIFADNPLIGVFTGLGLGLIIIILIIGYPLMLLFSWGMLHVTAGILHLLVIAFNGKEKYVETYKTVAYSTAPNIFGFIPYINWAAWVYSIVLQVIGISKRHKLTMGKSVAVVLIPIGVILILVIIFLFSIFAFSMLSAL